MRLKAIRMRHVRHFGSEGMAIENIPDGLSMLAEPNEFGKSTLFDAVKTVMFHKHSSKNTDTKRLASIDGAAPLIELDFTRDGDSYRLRKQFLRRSFAEVQKLESGQVIKIDGDAHEWMTDGIGGSQPGVGPTGLLWVVQGTSMLAPSADDTSKTLLAELLEHEMGDVIGGNRSRILLGRIQRELAKLITKHKVPQPTGLYKKVITSLEHNQNQIKDVQVRLTSSETLLTELIRIESTIKELEDPIESERLERQRKKATALFRESEESNSRLDVLKAQLATKTSERKRYEQELQDYRQNVENATTLHEKTAAAKEKRLHADTVEQHRKETLDQARIAEKAARQAQEKAEKKAELCARAESAAADRRQYNELQKKLTKAHEVNRALVAVSDQLNQNPVTDRLLSEMRRAKLERDRQQARLSATRPLLTPQLSQKGLDVITLDGLTISEPIHLSGTQVLKLGIFGELHIESNDPGDITESFEEAESVFAKLLSAHKIASIADAETMAIERRDLERQSDRLQDQLKHLAPNGLPTLQDDCARMRRTLNSATFSQDQMDELPDRETADQVVKEARQRYDDARNHRETSETHYHASVVEKNEIKSLIDMYTDRMNALTQHIGPREEWQDKQVLLSQVVTNAREAEKSLRTDIEQAEESIPSLETAKTDVQRLEKAIKNRYERLHKMKIQEAEIKRDLAAISEKGLGEELANLEQERTQLNRQRISYESQVAALQLLESELRSAQKILKEKFLQPVISELNPLLEMVLPNARVSLNEEFEVEVIGRHGREELVETLSGGTREQIAVLMRLAFAKFFAKHGREMPVVLDDALVWCDDHRLEKIFCALHEAAKDIQCIVLTCHERGFSTLGAPLIDVKKWPEVQ